MHLKAPFSKNHEVLGLSQGPNVKQRRKVKCKEHEGELIKFICKDCKQSVCQTCCLLKHSKHNFVSIETIVPEVKSALSEKRTVIERKMKQNTINVRNEESKIEYLKNRKTRSQEEIKSETKNGVALLREKEAVLLKELDEAYDQLITEHQANVKSGQITNQMYQQHCEFIDQALLSESEIDMYDMYHICLSGAVGAVGDTESGTRSRSVLGEVKFTSNMKPLKKAITEMGKVTWRGNSHGPNILSAPLLQDTIDIKHSTDTRNTHPNHVAVLTVDGLHILVVADYDNKNLKSVDVKSKSKSVLKLSNSPCAVAIIEKKIVVTNIVGYQIIIAEVNPKLSHISTLKTKTKKQYWGLTSLADSTLVAGSDSPPTIDILDLKGKVLRSFTPHNTGLDLIQNPVYLFATHEDNILVTDDGSKSVYCLTPKGNVLFTYNPKGNRALQTPRGITATHTGDILLADRNVPKLVQLTSDGTFVQDILPSTWHSNNTKSIWGLCFDDVNKLYMCLSENNRELIKVVSFKVGK